MNNVFINNSKTTADDIKRARKQLGLTQKEFAELVGISKPTIERWETSKQDIVGPIAILLQFLNKEYVDSHRIPEKKKPIRMWYMHKDMVCTLIDVDENRQEIDVINYVNNIQFRAFGSNEKPTYSDYQEFLESRCFAESRDRLKIILEDLDLPFYDPFMIIKKTKGRMAEDDFWIDIEE